MRLDKYLADAGIGSRSDVKDLIRKGRITVNGLPIKNNDYKLNTEQDMICFDSFPVKYQKFVYYMLNKPSGVVSATNDNTCKTVIDLLNAENRKNLFPVGRLDKDTTGLLLITDDGEFSHKILSPKKHVPKTYLALLDGKLNETEKLRIEQGIDIGDETITLPAVLHYESPDSNLIRITITEGRYHQVKRMFYAVGKNVVSLKRIQIGALKLDETLNAGSYRQLTENEISLCFDRTFK